MPALALPAFWGAVAAGTAGAGAVAGAEINSNASQSGVNAQVSAANQAANLQSQAAAQALAFNEQQAQLTQSNYVASQLGNYNQYARQQQLLAPIQGTSSGAVSMLGQLLGVTPNTVPPVPPPPNFQTYTPPTTAGGSGTFSAPSPAPPISAGASTSTTPSSQQTASANPTDPAYITQQLQGLYKSLGKTPTGPGTGPTDIAYMAQQIAATGGWQGGNIGYWTNKIGQLVNGSGTNAPASTALPVSAALGPPQAPTPAGPGFNMNQYLQPQTVGSALGAA